jgi:hypothetical protein
MSFELDPNYVDVASRIAEFRDKHPHGSLQPADPARPFQVVVVGDQTFIAYTAAAYRTPDDPRPGIGTAWEPIPGRTPYTRDSELQNAETSAWGRAIVAVLAADTRRGIASQEEVRARTVPAGQGGRTGRELLAELHMAAGDAVKALKRESSDFADLSIRRLLELRGDDLAKVEAYLRAGLGQQKDGAA